MKRFLFTMLCIVSVSSYSFAQQYATTDSGKKVILKENGKWEYIENKKETQYKITYEFFHNNANKSFQVLYDAPNNMTNSLALMGGSYNSGWRRDIHVSNLESSLTFKVASLDHKSYNVTLNIYVNDKLVKTAKGKTSNLLQDPMTLVLNPEDINL